jgi:hypothetical protein
VLAALPAHPIQLTHACHQFGFHAVVPLSWGDELIAEHVLRELKTRGRQPVVMCSCERVRARLLASGVELGRFLVSTVTPAVAIGRYLRSLYEGRHIRLTFIGSCEGGSDEVFDAQIAPANLLGLLREAGIDLPSQPTHFSAVVPPDRRRHASLPNGCPAADVMRDRGLPYGLAEIEGEDFVSQLAELLLAHDPVLVDVAPALGCACAGSGGIVSPLSARIAVMSLEPPRAPASPLVLNPAIDVALSVGTRAASRVIRGAQPATDIDVTPPAGQGHLADLPPQPPRRVWRPPAVTPPRALMATQASLVRASKIRGVTTPLPAAPLQVKDSATVASVAGDERVRSREGEPMVLLAPSIPSESSAPNRVADTASGVEPLGDVAAAQVTPAPRTPLVVRRVPPPQPRNRTAIYLGCLAVALAIAIAVAVILKYR